MNLWAQGTVIVLGAQGMLGSDLVPPVDQRVRDSGGRVLAWNQDDLDITDRARVFERIHEARPRVVINCAAYTDVDRCESNADMALSVNAQGAAHVAEACRTAGALLVHYSTDYVFDGQARRPYRPTDPVNPLSAYGRSKERGERAIEAALCDRLIIRTSWLYGLQGRNFVEAILSRAVRGEELKVVDDQVGRPTYTMDLAQATINLMDANVRGMIHFGNDGDCSWRGFAVEIVRLSGLNVPVLPIQSVDLDRPARRPSYSVLDLSSYIEATNHHPRAWKVALADCLARRRHRA